MKIGRYVRLIKISWGAWDLCPTFPMHSRIRYTKRNVIHDSIEGKKGGGGLEKTQIIFWAHVVRINRYVTVF